MRLGAVLYRRVVLNLEEPLAVSLKLKEKKAKDTSMQKNTCPNVLDKSKRVWCGLPFTVP